MIVSFGKERLLQKAGGDDEISVGIKAHASVIDVRHLLEWNLVRAVGRGLRPAPIAVISDQTLGQGRAFRGGLATAGEPIPDSRTKKALITQDDNSTLRHFITPPKFSSKLCLLLVSGAGCGEHSEDSPGNPEQLLAAYHD